MTFKTCQWISGDPTPFDECKCGAPTEKGGAWCAAHHAQVYVPRPPGEVRDVFALAFGVSTFRLPLGLGRAAVVREFDSSW